MEDSKGASEFVPEPEAIAGIPGVTSSGSMEDSKVSRPDQEPVAKEIKKIDVPDVQPSPDLASSFSSQLFIEENIAENQRDVEKGGYSSGCTHITQQLPDTQVHKNAAVTSSRKNNLAAALDDVENAAAPAPAAKTLRRSPRSYNLAALDVIENAADQSAATTLRRIPRMHNLAAASDDAGASDNAK